MKGQLDEEKDLAAARRAGWDAFPLLQRGTWLPAAAARCCCLLLQRRQEWRCLLGIPLPPATCCQHGFTALLKVLLVPGTDPGLLPLPNCQVAHKPE